METRRVHVRLGQSRTGQVFKADSAISSSAADALRDRGSKKQQGIVEVSEIFTSFRAIFSESVGFFYINQECQVFEMDLTHWNPGIPAELARILHR